MDDVMYIQYLKRELRKERKRGDIYAQTTFVMLVAFVTLLALLVISSAPAFL